nr:immunoglobulin light chain junction region [Macaca mulatta]
DYYCSSYASSSTFDYIF